VVLDRTSQLTTYYFLLVSVALLPINWNPFVVVVATCILTVLGFKLGSWHCLLVVEDALGEHRALDVGAVLVVLIAVVRL
jgi:hypothetical protein